MEASQIRSWCWQRPWAPTPLAGVPVELEGNSVALGGELEGQTIDGATMINDDIQRISEKIEGMSINTRREYERKIENEKIKQEEFSMTKRMDDSYRLTESDFQQRPLVPMRSPMRSPLRSEVHPEGNAFSPNRGYFPNDGKNGWV